jgi:hypothetical protein
MQTVLHTLFLPTPFKQLSASVDAEGPVQRSESEVLKPGALYAECAVVPVTVPPPPAPPENDPGESAQGQDKSGKGKGKDEDKTGPEASKQDDDGELGGIVLGTLVWDEYERDLKAWESAEEGLKRVQEEQKRKGEGAGQERRDGRHTPPTVDTPSG